MRIRKKSLTGDTDIFGRYLLALRKTPVDEKTEQMDRGALQTLLQAVADGTSKGISVQHEPKRVADKGAPDFKITRKGLILGYVENKTIGEHLDKVLKSEQIKRYKSLSQNILVTDYLHFVWISSMASSASRCATPQTSNSPSFACARIASLRSTSSGQLFFGPTRGHRPLTPACARTRHA